LVNYATQGAERTKTADKFISKKLGGIPDIQQVTKEAFKHKERQRVCSTISQALNLPPKLQDHETIHAIKTAGSTDWHGRSCVWSQALQEMSQIVS